MHSDADINKKRLEEIILSSLQDTIKKLQDSSSNVSNVQSLSTFATSAAPLTQEADASEGFIRNDNYKWYEEYSDTNFSSIDPVTKSIKLDSTQICITQESNSQIVPFEMNRFWEGIDISKMSIRIHYANKSKQEAFSTPVNVSCNDTTIRFIWLLDEYATQVAGDLTFEIMATGTNELGENYTWRTKPDGKMNVIASLSGNGVIKPSDEWLTQYFKDIDARIAQANVAVVQAEEYAKQAKASEDSINDVVSNVQDDITTAVMASFAEELAKHYTKDEVDTLLKNIDISDALKELQTQIDNLDGLKDLVIEQTTDKKGISFYNGKTLITTIMIDTTPPMEWVTSFKSSIETVINERISATQSDLDSYKTTTDAAITALEEKAGDIDGLTEQLSKNFYDKTSIDTKMKTKADTEDLDTVNNEIGLVKSEITAVDESIKQANTSITSLEEAVKLLQNSNSGHTYDITFDDSSKTYVQWTFYEDDEIKGQGQFAGGGGGGSVETSVITIEKLKDGTITTVKGDKALIEFNFSSVDNVGDATGDATGIWRVGSTTVATTAITQGYNAFDVSQYLGVGANTVRLTVTDSFGTVSSKTWSVNMIDMYLESNFDDFLFYTGEVAFRYTPYGDIEKTIHFVLDGVEISGVKTSISGRQMTQAIPAQTHGAHLLEVYATATVGSTAIESEHIFKDIIWLEPLNSTPIIGCSFTNFSTLQYNTVNIPYVVYSPSSSTTQVTLKVDDVTVSTLTVDRTKQYWSYRSSDIGTHTLKIICGDTVKTITAVINDLGIDVDPITTNLVFDWNPTGKSNNDADRLVINKDYSIEVSDNFDWTNGGYQIDDNGYSYFCVKAGTTATFPYQLFADDARKTGKNFKIVFKSTNVRDYNADILNCQADGIGLFMQAQNATLQSEQTLLDIQYVEDDIIEFEFNIRPDSDSHQIVTYEDGTSSRAKIYSASDNFTQATPVPIVVGSADCDVHMYRMKTYTMALTNDEVITNFIADGKDADEIINRYVRNNILNANGDLDADLVAEKCPDLRIVKISAPTFTTGKKNEIAGTTVQHIFKNGREVWDNWVGTGSHKGQGTTSNQYGEAARNIDINLKGGFTFADGSTGKDYGMTENSVPVHYFNIKVNVASSEDINNAILANRYNTYNPYLRDVRVNNPKIRDTMEFHPCVVFIQETDVANATEFTDGKWHFYSCGCFGNSKKNWQVFGNDQTNPLEVIVEISNNTSPQSRFLSDDLSTETWDGDGNFEFRYEADNITPEQQEVNKQNWQKFLSWVVNATPESFVAEFEDHCVKSSVLFHYLYTEFFTMVDNRAKNVFWHTIDGIHWDLCFNYDDDTAMGNNNEGNLVLSYGYEDTDQIGHKDVFNAADSKIFCYIRDYMYSDLQKLYIECENTGCFNSEAIIAECDAWQNKFPERLTMLNLQRKYFRPFEDNGTTIYLEEMMYGKKKYQRRQFLRYQNPYMSSKYLGNTCTSNAITLRGYTPTTWTGVKPDGTVKVTPYADMYVACRFGSTPTRIRAKRGETYVVENPVADMNDTEMYIYNASLVQAIGDLSACYVGYCDFSKAVKLREITIGSNVTGYQNTNLSTFNVGNNGLLEKLNLENLPNLKQAINLSGCKNLQEFYANGSGITGVLFANGGKLMIARIPDISSITAKNLIYLKELTFEDYQNLTSVVIENCDSIDILALLNKAPKINRVRLTGINWRLDDTQILDRLLGMTGIDENGYNTSTSVLEGKVYTPVMKQQQLTEYTSAWSGMEFSYDTLVVQFTVTFVNYNGDVLDIQYVDIGGSAVDPITRTDTPIPQPSKESIVSHYYTFAGWDTGFSGIFSNRTITATFDEHLRTYSVKYVSKGITLQESRGEYGASIAYEGDTPVYTSEESAYVYYLFKGWDKSGFIDGDKVINAIYDKFEYVEGCFDGLELADLRPVQLYGMMKVGIESDILSYKDKLTIPVGHDYSFTDIEERTLISEKTIFTGKNHIDTGIQLLAEDRDWVMAIDYKFDASNINNAVLAQCYKSDGSDGFKLWLSSAPRITYATASSYVAATGKRDMIILRHIKGETKIHIYKGNLPSESIDYTTLSSARDTAISSPLVFGCSRADDGAYENYAKGAIYWCKIWYADLGDDACRNLAVWTHEHIPMEVSNFKKFYLADNSGRRCSLCLLATQLLENTMPLSNTTSNTGGWAKATLNKFLNSRFYTALPIEWRQLLKEVKVSSTIGDKSSEVTSSNCHVSIPAIIELDSSMQYEPYSFEGETIPYIISNDDRIKTFEDGTAGEYFTRSPNHSYSSYVYTINEAGEMNAYSYALYEKAILVQLFL